MIVVTTPSIEGRRITMYAGLVTGEEAQRRLRQWIDRYDVQCMRCAD